MEPQKTQPLSETPATAPHAPAPTPDPATLAALRRVAETILAANERMNLTADRDPEIFWQRHIADAIAAARAIEAVAGRPGAGQRVLDVGAGGGIPGLAWAALWPEAGVELMETRGKRCEFLREAAATLGLANVRVIEGRAEELGHENSLRERYDLVTARALAAMPTLLELTLPFIKIGGWLGAIKSAPVEEELAQGQAALAILGGEAEVRVAPYARGDGKACAVCLARKGAPTPPAYPRRPNLPERRPLLKRD